MKKKRIYIEQWLALKPYRQHSATDTYYLNLSNKVLDVLRSPKSMFLHLPLEEEEDQLLSCFLVSYFEDIISQTRIWNTFTDIHQEMYGKRLPFFNTDAYDEGEINQQDVCFLIWYFINAIQQEEFFSPYSNSLGPLANQIMEIFEEAYEYAPENKLLHDQYQLKNTDDYYEARKFIDTILFKTYLFYPDVTLPWLLENFDVKKNYENVPELPHVLSEIRDSYLHKTYTGLLSLRGSAWAAEIAGKDHPLHKDLYQLSPKVDGFFLYKDHDDTYITLEHAATAKIFKLRRDSFNGDVELLMNKGELLHLGMVRWQGEWWFSGIFFRKEYDQAFLEQEKKSLSSRQKVAFLNEPHEKIKEVLQKQQKAFLEVNHGSPLAFLSGLEVNDFYKKFIDHYTSSLKASEKEKIKALEKAKAEGFSGDFKLVDPYDENLPDQLLLFFNLNSGVEVTTGIMSAFPAANNPYFKEEESKEDIMHMLISPDISRELALYCVEYFGEALTFFQQEEGKKYLEDLDFLLRFWKTEAYHTKPAITFF